VYSFDAYIVSILWEEKFQTIRSTVFLCISMYACVCVYIYIYIYIYIYVYDFVYVVFFFDLNVTVEARRLVKPKFYK